MEVDSPESAGYGQVSSKAGTQQRAAERAGGGNVDPVTKLAELESRLTAIEDMLRNVKGRGGITVNWPEIAFTGSSKITKATATCQGDSTILIEIESSP